MSDRQQVNEQLEAELSVLWRRVRRLSIDLARQVDEGLEAAAYGLLGLLADGGDVRAADLVERMGLDKSTVSRQITQMESMGLIQRVPDPQDGRARLLHITDTGRARVQQLRGARGRWFGAALEDWPDVDVHTLAVLLKRLNESLAQE
ncbi:MarR family winged helix-turn-helix transcriptional regulator [Jiangella sp. DSM 45060]|uniref:MarR family winged helix-turn-helix transcriptional regulator n=1 Tax=Jiangella sp. DSM 45060 TaxID=1798224 RepID=UPI0008798DD4|nr:MarR family transcriptional regulator [Jiangella sp. DSM 45060]SDS68626.1 DNA-binding transcriptional regulator, MarR family [Jiangella sp. DSM 45060]